MTRPEAASAVTRRALCVGLASFGPEPHTAESAPGALPALPYANERTRALSDVLSRLGYTCRLIDDPLPAAELGRLVSDTIRGGGPGDVLIVHILSHGHITTSGALYVVGADGRHHELTDVERWLKTVVDFHDETPTTLFLLDICFAGTAARFQWQPARADADNRAWVIAACGPQESAFNGRFTGAVTDVLTSLLNGDLDIDHSFRHAPLATVARSVRRAIVSGTRHLPQHVVGSLLDITSEPPDLAFFPNPRFVSNPRRKVRPTVDAAVAPFLDDLDEALDVMHFVGRAAGAPINATGEMTGYFSGRSRELRILSPWLNLQDDVGLRVLTGSPGVGKSAILGVLVCAAHPRLRQATRAVWEHIEQAPYANTTLAAVHARQRTLDEVAASIHRQLGGAADADPAGDAVARALRAAAGTTVAPVIVVDALDEAIGGVEIMTRLLIPLSRIKRADRQPIRLLVGTRPWAEFAPLRDAGRVTDLDEVEPERLRADVSHYVSRLLLADTRWDRLEYEGSARSLARAVAETLAANHRKQEWGAFLVAGLFTHHVLRAFPEPIRSADEALRLGATIPRTLPDLLDLDLGTRSGTPLLRPVLSALAHARGDGMPAEVIQHVTADFTAGEVSDAAAIRAALGELRFYLRHSADIDGTTSYRLFHQGLADHLRKPEDATPVFDSLLGALAAPDGGALRWDLAPPYLLRHIGEHAIEADRLDALITDAGYLATSDPEVVLRHLDQVQGDEARTAAALYISADLARVRSAVERREHLVAAALRATDVSWAQAFSAAGGVPAAWTPLWMMSLRRTDERFVTMCELRGRPAVVTRQASSETGGTSERSTSRLIVRVAATGRRLVTIAMSERGPTASAIDIATVGGQNLVVYAQDSVVTAASVYGNARYGVPFTPSLTPTGLRLTTLAGQPAVLVSAKDQPTQLWDLRSGTWIATMTGPGLPDHGALVGTTPVRLSFTRGNPRTISIEYGDEFRTAAFPAQSLAAAVLGAADGHLLIYTGSGDGRIRVFDTSCMLIASVLVGEPIHDLHATGDGHVIAVTSSSIVVLAYHPPIGETSEADVRVGIPRFDRRKPRPAMVDVPENALSKESPIFAPQLGAGVTMTQVERISAFTPSDIVEIRSMQHAFRSRYFGGGYDRVEVDRYFAKVYDLMSLQHDTSSTGPTFPEPPAFATTRGGYDPTDVDSALAEARDTFRAAARRLSSDRRRALGSGGSDVRARSARADGNG